MNRMDQANQTDRLDQANQTDRTDQANQTNQVADPLEKKIELAGLPEKKTPAMVVKAKRRFFKKPGKKTLIISGLAVVFLLVLIPLLVVIPVLSIKKNALALSSEGQAIYASFQTQDLAGATQKIESTRVLLGELNRSYRRLIWIRYLPYFGNFYKDGERLVKGTGYLLDAAEVTTKALEPYADILGFVGTEEKETEAMTAEDRIFLALDTLDKIQPHLDEIAAKLQLAQGEVDQIEAGRYPEELAGRKVREKVVVLKDTVDGVAQLTGQIQPIVGFLKPLMGVPDKKQYLLLFQNDAELRPTGGFMTAYALLTVNNGKLTPGSSFDIYTLDARFGNRLPAPEPIKNYLPKVSSWHLRDMNLSPDFAESMQVFWENAESSLRSGQIDGIIAVDTNVLVDILEVLGPIGVAEWGNFTAESDPRCDCPQVFYELEAYADRPVGTLKEERKGIIGPLMHSILLNAMGSPRKKWPQFFNVALENIQEKHILLYFFDEEIQKAAEALNAGGTIKEFEGDYLHLNDTNFGGAKSNMFIEETVTQDIEVGDDGSVVKTVTVEYRNPAPPSDCNLERGELCLNGLYRDWIRLYVPRGSELLESSGSEVEIKTYEELGKTVFEGFYGDSSPLRPQGKAQITFKYKLPFQVKKGQEYRLLIQKQPGAKNHLYVVNSGGRQVEEFELATDRELKLKI